MLQDVDAASGQRQDIASSSHAGNRYGNESGTESDEEVVKDHDDEEDTEDDDANSTPDGEPVEPLFAGREQRETRGNRYAALLAQEAEEDDELGLLFNEDGEDDEFDDPDIEAVNEAGDDSDESDTDEDDNGPTTAVDDLEGEMQLQREERQAKPTKRKAASTLPVVRKRVKIDDAAAAELAEALKAKRQKRGKPLAMDFDKAARTSSRTLSVQNKERTLASMKENELRRNEQLAQLRETRKKKKATQRQPLTQAEKLEEAARTEKINSKSLSRWEQMERTRIERQNERLEAMQNRRLEGPIVRFRSARVQWTDGKLVDHAQTRGNSAKDEATGKAILPPPGLEGQLQSLKHEERETITSPLDGEADNQNVADVNIDRNALDGVQGEPPEHDPANSLLEEMRQYVSKDETVQPVPEQTTGQVQHLDTDNSTLPAQVPVDYASCSQNVIDHINQNKTPAANPDQSSILPRQEFATRNTITFYNFSDSAIRDPAIQRHVLLKTPLPTTIFANRSVRASLAAKQSTAPTRTAPATCVITSLPARYRDPVTGLPFAGTEAFATLKSLVAGGCVWSNLLGAWVGGNGLAAVGVPVGFSEGDGYDAGSRAPCGNSIKAEASIRSVQ